MHEEERGSKKEKWYSVVSEPDQGEKGYKNLSLKDVKEKALRKEKVRVVRAFKEQDCFEEHFEMANFPLDHQHLTIGVTTKWDHTVAAISFEQHQPTVNPSLHVSQVRSLLLLLLYLVLSSAKVL